MDLLKLLLHISHLTLDILLVSLLVLGFANKSSASSEDVLLVCLRQGLVSTSILDVLPAMRPTIDITVNSRLIDCFDTFLEAGYIDSSDGEP